MANKSPVFPLFLFPNIQYLRELAQYPKVYIETMETCPKQTFRNRFIIYSESGPMDIIIPIQKQDRDNRRLNNAIISYKESWNRRAYRAIIAAYSNSPYFEYFWDEISGFFLNEYQYLAELNLEVLSYILKRWEIGTEIETTKEYKPSQYYSKDYREGFLPRNQRDFQHKEYFQCFNHKHGFINNLSCLDLLFNEGRYGRNFIFD